MRRATQFVLGIPTPASVAVAGTADRFAVRRIFCVGRNYAAHAREMGRDPDQEPPFFFAKPADAVVDDGVTIPYPTLTKNLHHEGELVVAVGKSGVNIAPEQALEHVWGYAIGNDLTRRDLQSAAKTLGRPWDWGKGFDRSAICGPVHPAHEVGHLVSGEIRVDVNGETRQRGDLSELIWPVSGLISILSQAVEIRPGDLVYTGTPAGVGPLVPGNVCKVSIEGLGTLSTTIAAPDYCP